MTSSPMPNMPLLLSPEWMRAYLLKCFNPRSLVWKCSKPSEVAR